MRFTEYGDYYQVLQCLNDGVNINAQNNNNQTPLHIASLKGMANIVKLLLENGADINIQDNLGRTALHYAASANNADMVEFLLKEGAKANIKNNNSRKPSSFTENKKIIGLFENPREY